MAATDARPVPQYGAAFRVYFALRYLDGRLDTGWINPSGFISKDNGAFANVTTNPTEIGGRGCGYCDLTATEMTADGVVLILQDSKAIMGASPNSGIPLVLTFYPEQVGDYRIAVPSGAIAEAVWNEQMVGNIAAGTFGDALNQASGTILRQGATGAGLTAIPTVANVTTVANLTNMPSGAIAQAVWDRQVSTSRAAGTFGDALNQASGTVLRQGPTGAGLTAIPTIANVTTVANLTNFPSGAVADSVWNQQVARNVYTGTFGQAVNAASGNTIAAVIGNSVWTTPATRQLTATQTFNLTGNITGTITRVDHLTNFPSGAIADAVWDEAMTGHNRTGSMGDALSQASGLLITRLLGTIAAGTHNAQTGDSYARIGAGGASLNAIPTIANVTTVANLTNFPSGAIADAVWDENLPSHLASDSAGDWLYISATRNVDPWDEDLTTYGAGTAAHQIYSTITATSGTVLNGTIDSNVISVNGVPVDESATIDANIVQVSGVNVTLSDFNTGGTGGDSAATIWAYANRTLTSFPSGAFAEAVWNETVAGNIAAGTFGDALNMASGTVLRQGATGAGLTAIPTIANVTTVANLTNFPSGAVADAVWDEQINTHQVFGTAGRALMAASGDAKLAPASITSTTFATDAISAAAFSQAAADEVWNTTSRTITGGTVANLTNFPSGAVADAVWDEVLSGHQVFGTTGYALNAASGNFIGAPSVPSAATIADAVWDEVITAHNINASAGHAMMMASGILNNIIRADMVKFSGEWVAPANAVPANITQVSGQLIHIADFNRPTTGSISSSTFAANAITSTVIAADAIGSSQLATTAVDEIVDQVWNEVLSTHLTAGTTGDALNQASGTVLRQGPTGAGLSAIPTIAAVTTVTNLTNAPTAGDFTATMKTSIGTAVWTTPATRTITGGTVDNLTNLASGAIADAVWDEAIAQHQVLGTTGYALNTASGNLIGGSSLTAAQVWAYSPRTLTGIVDANIVQVSGQAAGAAGIIPANVIQVSGAYVTLGDFSADAAANKVWAATSRTITGGTVNNLTNLPSGAIAEMVWNEQVTGNIYAGTFGDALNTASGILLRQGATGAGLTAIPTIANVTTVANLTNFPSGAVADAVWDEQINTHGVFGTAGRALTAASGNDFIGVHASPTNITAGTITTTTNLTNFPSGAVADAVWDEVLSQHQTIGTAGYALNAASGNLIGIPTGLTAADVWNYATRQLTSFPSGAFAEAVWNEQVTGNIYAGTFGDALNIASGIVLRQGATGAGLTAIPTVANVTTVANLTNFPSGAIADAVWDEALSQHQTIGTTGYALNTASGNLIGGTTLTAAQVWTYADRQLTSFPSGAFADAVWDEVLGQHQVLGTTGYALNTASGNLIGGTTLTAAQVWTYSDRQLTSYPSGAFADAVWDEVLGGHQTIGTAGYALNVASGNLIGSSATGSLSGIIDANIVSISGVKVNIDSQSVADSQELSTLGDLLLRRARIIRLVP